MRVKISTTAGAFLTAHLLPAVVAAALLTPSCAANALIPLTAQTTNLDAPERQRVVRAVIGDLRAHYFDPRATQNIAAALLADQKNREYTAITYGQTFAALLTTTIRTISHDTHLEVVYSLAPLPTQPAPPTTHDLALYRQTMQRQNCMFEKVAILPHNIGYIKLNFFPDTSVCQSTATAAMASLNHADAIIFDIRDNTGGFPVMVTFIAAYLFDHPVYIYNPREAPTPRSRTRSPVPGNNLANKPVYVLTSSTTMSGAEQFCYNLKMLKRATLIGQTTRGAAHAGVWYRIDEHFGIAVPEVKPHNPYSNTDWEGVGVQPDVQVNPADALITAEKMAERALQTR